MSVLQRIRQKVQRGEFVFSEHAYDELKNDFFTTRDAVSAIMNGSIVEKLTHDERGIRYVILGRTSDGRNLELVCRFQETGNLLIITGYTGYE